MAYDPGLWAPADLPGYFQLPKTPVLDEQTEDDQKVAELSKEISRYSDELAQVLNRQQAQLSRVVKLLNRYRITMDAEAPAASGSGFLWIDRDDGRLYYDQPEADPVANPPQWRSVNTFFNEDFTVWDDKTVSAQSTKPGSSAPTWTNITGNVSTYVFANAQSNFVEFSCQIPHKYKLASNIHPHIHWGPADATSGNVKWQLDYSWANIDGTFSGSTAIFVTAAAGGAANKHQVAEFSAINGAGKGISSMLLCKLKRLGSDGADTYAAGANFYEFDFHVEIDSLGSDQEYVK